MSDDRDDRAPDDADGIDDVDDIAPDEPAPAPERPVRAMAPGRIVRMGLIGLVVFGGLTLYLGITTAADPAAGVCAQARRILEDESEDEDFDADDLECEEAIARAEQSEEHDLGSEASVRTFGFILAFMGAVQAVGAVLTLRRQTKANRMVALVGLGLGIIIGLGVFGIFAVLLYGAVLYAIFFSADARAVFGDPGGPKVFRPRR